MESLELIKESIIQKCFAISSLTTSIGKKKLKGEVSEKMEKQRDVCIDELIQLCIKYFNKLMYKI